VVRRLPEPLRLAPPALLAEAPLARGLRRLRRRPRAPRPRRPPQLLEHALGRELPVAKLRALVLRNRPHGRPEPGEHATTLAVAERFRRVDVEERLHARRGLLRVLTAGPARARDPERDLAANRLGVHGGDSAGRRRRPARLW